MENAQGPISTRKEDQTGFRIKTGIIDTGADRKAVDYFSCDCIHDDHLRLIAATDKQAFLLSVISETGRHLRHADGKALFDLQRLWIEDHYLGGVFAVDINKTISSDDRLFTITLHFYRPDNFAGRGVEGSDIVRAMIIGEYALRSRIVIDAVRPLADIDFLDELQRGRVEHRDLILPAVAGESMFESRSNRDPVDP